MFLFGVFSICVFIQACFGLWMLWKIPDLENNTNPNLIQNEGVTILICAKNEAQNLENNLPKILNQALNDFEVIVVNDASTDNSENILKNLKTNYPNLIIVTINKEDLRALPGKKHAIQQGLKVATYDNIVLCDADCTPSSKNWATLMSQKLSKGKEICLGYAPYIKAKGLLNPFIRWETLHSFIQYGTYANSGLAYMGVGRNMACKKNLLIGVENNPLWQATTSGDDDLFVRLKSTKKNVAIAFSLDALCYSLAKSTFKEWVIQKQRHLSTGKLYKPITKILLGSYGLSHGLMWLLIVPLLFQTLAYLALQLLVLRCILYWSIWADMAQKIKDKKLIIFLPFCDICWALYNLFFSPYIFLKNQKKWK